MFEKKVTLVLLGSLLAHNIVRAAETDLPPFVPLEDEAPVKKLVLESSLKDPFSVQFRNLSIQTIHLKGPPEETSLIYCGELNAKNSMGAYAGWSKFYATSLGKNVYISKKPNDYYFNLYCRDAPNLQREN